MDRGFRMLDLADAAASQWGMFTTAQARALGATAQHVARAAKASKIERIRHGVYRIAGSPPDYRDEIRAAWLLVEPEIFAYDHIRLAQPATVSHRSAARLHELGDLDADVMDFTVARRKQTRSPDIRYRVRNLDREEWTLLDGLPVTTIRATLADLAADHIDGGHLARVVRDAAITHTIPLATLAEVLLPYADSYGAPIGDPSTLIERFLTEAGVPQTINEIAAITAPANMERAITALRNAAVHSTGPDPYREPLLQLALALESVTHEGELVDTFTPPRRTIT